MKLHENKELFKQAVQFASQEKGIPEIFIEKDYWVTLALYNIFKSDIGPETVFKGGTSLLKCYGLINRFSEDIDLVVLRREKESNNKLTSKIKAISSIVSQVLPEVELPEITVKMGMNRKTAHSYQKYFTGNFGQVRDIIIVEATWLGYFEPHHDMHISSFIYDMMLRREQENLAKEYGLQPFMAKVLSPARTLCEKIMSLVRFSYSSNPIRDLQMKIRHMYDLHQLLQAKTFSDFFSSDLFVEMLLKVGQDDVTSYRSNNLWLRKHPKDALIFSDLEMVWGQVKNTYATDFRALVFGDKFPSGEEILQTMKQIKQRLMMIDWNLAVPMENAPK